MSVPRPRGCLTGREASQFGVFTCARHRCKPRIQQMAPIVSGWRLILIFHRHQNRHRRQPSIVHASVPLVAARSRAGCGIQFKARRIVALILHAPERALLMMLCAALVIRIDRAVRRRRWWDHHRIRRGDMLTHRIIPCAALVVRIDRAGRDDRSRNRDARWCRR